jgi:hypothetical protein
VTAIERLRALVNVPGITTGQALVMLCEGKGGTAAYLLGYYSGIPVATAMQHLMAPQKVRWGRVRDFTGGDDGGGETMTADDMNAALAALFAAIGASGALES